MRDFRFASEVVFITKVRSAMQTDTRERNLPSVPIQANTAQSRRPVVQAMDAETVEIFAAPVEGNLGIRGVSPDPGISRSGQPEPSAVFRLYGTYCDMNVPQFAKGVLGRLGIYSLTNQILPSVLVTAVE
jgi:hypothetical protein